MSSLQHVPVYPHSLQAVKIIVWFGAGEDAMDERKRGLLKNLPKIDELMLQLEKRGLTTKASKDLIREACRSVVENSRKSIIGGNNDDAFRLPAPDEILSRVQFIIDGYYQYRLCRVINASGIILHTNLGRAPLCREAIKRIEAVSAGYSNLEYDLTKGQRGLRYDHIRDLLCTLSGAEDALVVNNNAAAVLLVLNTLSAGREAIVSRGELVEVGGEFRIPEVMEKSGARLCEVGATNRTRITDYENAVGENTGLIMKVHTSNFRIIGFTEEAGIDSLVSLGRKHGIPVMHDLGSGCFIELDRYGLEREPTVKDVLATGVDVVTFSGDKLLGGPQAGIILGRKDILQLIKKNPLNRALRIDKLTLAALEATLMHYLQPDRAVESLRILKALTEPLARVTRRAKRLQTMLRNSCPEGLRANIRKGSSLAGGGSLPMQEIPTALIALKAEHFSSSALESRLRKQQVPIIVRIEDDELLLDLRTIENSEFAIIRDTFKSIVSA